MRKVNPNPRAPRPSISTSGLGSRTRSIPYWRSNIKESPTASTRNGSVGEARRTTNPLFGSAGTGKTTAGSGSRASRTAVSGRSSPASRARPPVGPDHVRARTRRQPAGWVSAQDRTASGANRLLATRTRSRVAISRAARRRGFRTGLIMGRES